MAATPDPVTLRDGWPDQAILYLGIFDDGDVAPTVVFMELYDEDLWPYTGTADDAAHYLAQFCQELREAGEREYKRKAPDHALFWHATPS